MLMRVVLLAALAHQHGGVGSSPQRRVARPHGASTVSGRPRQRLPYNPPRTPPSSALAGVRQPRAGAATPSVARQITQRLSRAGSAAEILAVFESDGADCNDINLCTVWNQLGKARLSRREREHFFSEHDETLRRLQRRTESILPRLTPRNLAGVPYGIARLGFRPGHSTMRLIAAEAAPRLAEFNSQELANMALAFATAGVHEPELFARIAEVASVPSRISQFNAQELANTAWAFAKAGVAAPELFAAIAAQSEPRLREFIAQGLSNMAWAFATAGVPAESLLDALAEQAAPRLHEFKPQELSILAWAFATAGAATSPLFNAIAAEAFPRVSTFTTQGLANLVWAFARASIPAEALFAAVAREACGGVTVGGEERPSRLSRFTPQEIANTAFAFARAEVRDARLSDAIARESLGRIGDFNEQELANMAWAFASTGMVRVDLFEAMAQALLPTVAQLSPAGLTNTLLAFSKAGWPLRDKRELRAALAHEAVRRAPTLEPTELANIAWSHAVSAFLPAKLVRALCARAAELGPGSFMLEERSALHQFFVGAELQLRPPAAWLPPAPMLAACREGMVVQAPLYSSQLHLDVSAMLARVGIAHVNELCVPTLGYHVDIAIVSAEPPAAGGGPVGAGGGRGHQSAGSGSGAGRGSAVATAGAEVLLLEGSAVWVAANQGADALFDELGLETDGEAGAYADGFEPARAAAAAASAAGSPSPQLVRAAAARAREAVRQACAKCKGLVIEVNGPSHYDFHRRLRPESQMKRRHLALDGWAVLEVPWWEWAAVNGAARKAAYLSSLLLSSAERIIERSSASASSLDGRSERAPRGEGRALRRSAAARAQGAAAALASSDAGAAGSAASSGEAGTPLPFGGSAADETDRVVEWLVETVPGVSAKRAKVLRAHIGAQDPFTMSWQELRCAGVGATLAQRVVRKLAAMPRLEPSPPKVRGWDDEV